MTKRAVVLILLLALSGCATMTVQPYSGQWNFHMTIPSDDSFFTFEGKGILSYEGEMLSGEVRDKNGLAHRIELTVHGGRVEGTFETMQSDAGPFKLKGVASKKYDERIGSCWHNIVAHDAANALTLVAVSDRCEP